MASSAVPQSILVNPEEFLKAKMVLLNGQSKTILAKQRYINQIKLSIMAENKHTTEKAEKTNLRYPSQIVMEYSVQFLIQN